MPHLPYQPRPMPPSAMAPLATPLPRAMEEVPLPAEPIRAKSAMPPKSAALPTKPRLRSNRIGLDTVSIRNYEPEPGKVYKYSTGKELDSNE